MGCEKVDEEIYDFLCKFAIEPSLQWMCHKCVGTGKRTIPEITFMKESQQILKEKVDDLANSMSSKLEELVSQMNSMSTVNQVVNDTQLDDMFE